MVGSQFVFANGVSAGTINARGSNTSLTVTISNTVTPAQGFSISYTGFHVTGGAGVVGIGTTTPVGQLEIASQSTELTRGIIVRNANTLASIGAPLRCRKSRGTLVAPLDIADGDTIASFIASPYSGTDYFSTGELDFDVDGIFTSGQAPPSKMVVYTNIANGQQTAQMTVKGNGNVGLGTLTPNANAILDVTSTTKAFMPPRMTTVQKNAIASPTAGMIVYDSSLNKLSVYGASWETITSV